MDDSAATEMTEEQRRLAAENVGLVKRIVKSMISKGKIPSNVEFADAVSEGYIGLCRAAQGFKAELGYKFCTYADWWIRQRILRFIRTNHLIRPPHRYFDKPPKDARPAEAAYREQARRVTNVVRIDGLCRTDRLGMEPAYLQDYSAAETREEIKAAVERLPTIARFVARKLLAREVNYVFRKMNCTRGQSREYVDEVRSALRIALS